MISTLHSVAPIFPYFLFNGFVECLEPDPKLECTTWKKENWTILLSKTLLPKKNIILLSACRYRSHWLNYINSRVFLHFFYSILSSLFCASCLTGFYYYLDLHCNDWVGWKTTKWSWRHVLYALEAKEDQRD